MSIEYTPDEQMTKTVADLISDPVITELKPLREHNIAFLVAQMRKHNSDDESVPTSGDPVVIRKVAAADAVFVDGQYKLYIDGHRWDEANAEQRNAMLHRALLRVSVEETDDGLRLGMRKPDVSTFQKNIERYGAWESALIALRNAFQVKAGKK